MNKVDPSPAFHVEATEGAGPQISKPQAKRMLVIFNPTAGRRQKRKLDAVVKALQDLGATVQLLATQARGDAEAFARQARITFEMGLPQSGEVEAPDVVVAAGGDGTINEVVNGLLGSDLPLAIIPLGTANVLAAEIGLPSETKKLARVICFGEAVDTYIGLINRRAFIQMAGAGMDADVVAGVSKPLKRLLGKGAYGLAILRWLIKPSKQRYRLSIEGQEYDAATVIFSNGRYYGGRFLLAPKASIHDNALLVTVFQKGGRWSAVLALILLGLGRIEIARGVKCLQCRTATLTNVEGEEPRRLVQADGDIVAKIPAQIGISTTPIKLVGGIAL